MDCRQLIGQVAVIACSIPHKCPNCEYPVAIRAKEVECLRITIWTYN